MAEEDIIFGKNRHFFGGLEPSNMKAFNLYVENNEVMIDAQLPDDTIVDGQTLCSIGGAVIRRKVAGFPRDEFDGDLVLDIKSTGLYKDSTANPTSSYFYRVFPYSTKGVYNRNAVHKYVFNEPDPLVSFSAKSSYDAKNQTPRIQLNIDLPDSAAGAVIRKNIFGYPVDELDGDECMTVTSDGVYFDTDVEVGFIYYYSAFPYTVDGAFNYDVSNRASVEASTYQYVFGYDLDLDDGNPNTRVSYPADVDNSTYAKAYMNFSAGVFNYGGWNLAPGEKFMPKPCMLTVAGVVDQYLDPNNYALKEDGTASDVANTSFNGNAMMEWPKIYTKRWEENGIYHFRCSDAKLDDDYECWCNYDINNNEIDHFYTSIYPASLRGSSFCSISGQTIAKSDSAASYYVPPYATKVGADWYIDTAVDYLLITDLLVMMAKTTDCNTAYGGWSMNMNGKMNTTGLRNTDGMFFGADMTINNTELIVKVFGMEQWFGVRRYIAGWINKANVQYLKITRGTKDGSTSTDYNTDGSGYIKIDGANITASSEYNGYVNACKTTPYGRIPYAGNGSKTTYECDNMFCNKSTTGTHYVSIGGEGVNCGGPFSVNSSGGLTYAFNNYAGLSCKPSAT